MDTPSCQRPSFRIARDGSSAALHIPRAFPAGELDQEQLEGMARELGLAVDEALQTALRAAIESFRGTQRDIDEQVAWTTAPVPGSDGRLEWLEGYAPVVACTPRLRGDGRVDHHSCHSYRPVEDGAEVARLHPPTAGTDGRDVTGRPIKATAGRKCDVRFDASFTVDVEGRVRACRRGLIEMHGNQIRIADVFQVPGSVDFSTGNVEFDGSVVIGVGILDCFHVKASENIVVQGLVQAATIECGGNFICPQGMAGRGRGRLRVSGTVDAGYLDRVCGAIRGDLKIRRELIGCTLVIGGDLDADGAAVIGGEIGLGGSARIGQLGARSGTTTTLIVGATALRGLRLRRLEIEAAEIQASLEACEQTRGRLARITRREGDEPSRRLAALAGEIDALRQTLDANRDMSAQITGSPAVDARHEPRSVDVTGVVHPGVCLVVGDYEAVFDRPLKGPVRIACPEQLQFHVPGGAHRPLVETARVTRRAG